MRRNRLLLCERHSPPAWLLLNVLKQTAGSFVRLGLSAFSDRQTRLTYRAWAMGTFDYLFRRFGDCPSMIRKMAAEYR